MWRNAKLNGPVIRQWFFRGGFREQSINEKGHFLCPPLLSFTLFCFTQGPQGQQGVQGERGQIGEGLPGPKVS